MQFIQFDGAIDQQLGQFLSSALDDNHAIELPSGDKICLNNYIRFVFEVESLDELPQQIIDRCAIVQIERPADLWKAYLIKTARRLYQSEYARFRETYRFDEEQKDFVKVKSIENDYQRHSQWKISGTLKDRQRQRREMEARI